MALVRLKGIKKVSTRLADGSAVTYWYAWVGGPRLPGKPGDPEFIKAYTEAHKARKVRPGDDLTVLVTRYRAAPEFTRLAPATRKEWDRWLNRITEDDIGALSWAALDDRRVRADLLEWRDQWHDRPRSADYAVQVLGRVLAFGVDRGILERNALAGVEPLYKSNRADQVWTEDEIVRVCAAGSAEVGFALRLACLTGLRRADLISLTWAQVGDTAIEKSTSKSGGHRQAIVPILPETRRLLEEIREANRVRRQIEIKRAEKAKRPPRPEAVTVLTNTRGQPWSKDGIETQLIKAKTTAKVDKRLHDARGTFATRLSLAGLNPSEISGIMAWEEGRVERLLDHYVHRETVVRALIRKVTRPDP